MKLCTDTITLFNAKVDPATGYDVYTPTIIRGVSWYRHAAVSVNSNGLQTASTCTIRIPMDADTAGKVYLSPAEYARLEDPAGYYTLTAGDIVVKGVMDTPGLRPADIRNASSDMCTVKEVVDNRRAPNAPHWRLIAV